VKYFPGEVDTCQKIGTIETEAEKNTTIQEGLKNGSQNRTTAGEVDRFLSGASS
jgi:hypothetical protein